MGLLFQFQAPSCTFFLRLALFDVRALNLDTHDGQEQFWLFRVASQSEKST